MSASEVADGVTAYWDARAPRFDGAAAHVRSPDDWTEVLSAAFCADGPKDVVDLGTGTGACALAAASLGHRVRAYDGSAQMLAVARAAAGKAGLNIEFVQALITDAPLEPASADIVTIRNVLWTLERPGEALQVARRTLRLGGRVVVSDGMWLVAPGERSDYAGDLAARLPFHAGLREVDAQDLLKAAGFTEVVAWQHLFRSAPYPGGVPMFVLSARRDDPGQ
ncbi:class I SAM-dependent methyltransferase [Methylobacterium sp. E-066]|uniref:class I SAM-dependent methyltransferase n=1 Tax=Methylobacterium sp. E-066 TaxID=2836584 RepID=UPI001FB89CD8|nr:class I SAM-dependent methyltransferase [Methylobacterium sp. E-066]MCJ2140412.1 class I SAM-dependent methyltransferase [Methylobacterium sp. E-066]